MPALPETSIRAVATRVDIIEQAEPLPPNEVVLGQGTFRKIDEYYPQTAGATLRNYHLSQVHLDTRARTLIKDGFKIKETYYLVPPKYYDAACVAEQSLIRLDQGINYIMAREFNNYYHWLAQTVPAVDWSLRHLPPAHFSLLTGELKERQVEILALLGHEQVPRVALDAGHHYAIPELDYSEFQNGTSSFEVSLSAQATFNRIKSAAVDGSPAHADIVYVARTDTKSRVAVNEAAVIKLLEAEGIAIVVPGHLSQLKQINLFAKAQAIIGPHGAGLTNVAFGRPGAVFYELMPGHYQNPCFARLAQSAGLTYIIDIFAAEPEPGTRPHDPDWPHEQGWIIDPEVVLKRVHEIKQRVAWRPYRPVFMPASLNAIEYLKAAAQNPVTPPMPAVAAQAPEAPEIRPVRPRSWLSRLFDFVPRT